MKTLRELVDLDTEGRYDTDKDTTHSYIEVYDKLLNSYQDKPVELLEIGNNGGGSIKLWDDYFSDVQITGLEINRLEPLEKLNEKQNIDIKMGVDAYIEPTLVSFTGRSFDIIIDDGSHAPIHQLFALTRWSQLLKPGGLLVIEDIQDINIVPALLDRAYMSTEEKENVEVYDLRKNKQRADDIILCYRKQESK